MAAAIFRAADIQEMQGSQCKMGKEKIMIVDDESAIADLVGVYLENEGYEACKFHNATDALDFLERTQISLAVLDVMLPDDNGFVLMEQLKQLGDFPVLFLTARGEDEDKFKGFGLGADDYIVKPFLPKELLLRITAILRRSYKEEQPLVRLADSEIDFARAQVQKGREQFPLTAKEYAILTALYRNAGRIVTIDALCEAAWGDNPYGYENSLMAHIRHIREKIEKNPSRPVSLVTARGLGYKLLIKEH